MVVCCLLLVCTSNIMLDGEANFGRRGPEFMWVKVRPSNTELGRLRCNLVGDSYQTLGVHPFLMSTTLVTTMKISINAPLSLLNHIAYQRNGFTLLETLFALAKNNKKSNNDTNVWLILFFCKINSENVESERDVE